MCPKYCPFKERHRVAMRTTTLLQCFSLEQEDSLELPYTTNTSLHPFYSSFHQPMIASGAV